MTSIATFSYGLPLTETITRSNLSILLVGQNLHVALELADKVYIMTKGRVVYEGLPEDLSRDEQTKEQELGIGAEQEPDSGFGGIDA